MRIIFLLLLFTQLFSSQKIITLTPALSEIVFALGRGDELIGVSKYATYPKKVQKINKVGDYFNPNLEYIISLKPTLVITQDHQYKILDSLKKFHIKTLGVNLDTISNIKKSIKQIAKQIDAKKKADILVKDIDNAIKHTKKSQTNEKVLLVFGLNHNFSKGVFVANKEIYFNEILSTCGVENAFNDPYVSVAKLNYENIIALNPDRVIILDAKHKNTSQLSKNSIKAWKKLPIKASKNSKISHLDENYITMPSHRVALAIKRLCKEISDD